MAIPKRAKIALWVLGVFVVLLAALAFAGWRFYQVYRDPARFLEMARDYAQEREYDAAMDQYRRALAYSRGNAEKAAVFREMAETVLARPPQPVADAVSSYQSVISLWAGLCRADRGDTEIQRRMLESQFEVARQARAQWGWRSLHEIADMIERLTRGSPAANKYRAIAKLMMDEEISEEAAFYDDINSTLSELQEDNPDDLDLAYYLAMSNLAQASNIGGNYMPLRGRQLVDNAWERMETFVQNHPNDLEAQAAFLHIGTRGAWMTRDFDWLPALHRLAENLEAALLEQTVDPELTIRTANSIRLLDKLQAAANAQQDPGEEDVDIGEAESGLERSMTLLRKAHEDHPENLRIMLGIAVNLREKDRSEEAIARLEEVLAPRKIPVTPNAIGAQNARLRAHFLVADLKLRQIGTTSDPEEREALMDRVRKEMEELEEVVSPNSPHLQLLEGRIAFHNENYREAVRKLTQASEELGARTPEATFYTGLGLARLGETGAAVKRLAEFLSTPGALAEHREQAWVELASCAVRLRDFDQAVKIARHLLQHDPGDEEANLLLGRALLLQVLSGRITNQEDAFREAVSLLRPLAEGGNPTAVQQLARIYEIANDWPAAHKLLSEYCDKHPQDTNTLAQFYHGLVRNDSHERAAALVRERIVGLEETEPITLVKKALGGDPGLRPHIGRLLNLAMVEEPTLRLVQLAQFYRSIGRPGEIDRVLREAAAIDPNDPAVLSEQFTHAIEQNHLAEAEEILAAFEQVAPNETDVAPWQASLHIARENHGLAISLLNETIAADPHRSNLYQLLGEAYQLKGDLYNAEENYRKAFEMKPDEPYTLRRLIQISARRGHHNQALKYMRRALRFSPNDRELMTVFLDYLAEYGSETQALEIRLRLASMRPNDYANRRAIADLYLRARQPEKAQGVLRKLLEDAPDQFANVRSMAWFEARTGNVDSGKKRLRQFLEDHEDEVGIPELLSYAEYLFRTGNQEEAEEAARRAVEKEGSTGIRAEMYLGDLFLLNGEYEKALQTYGRILTREVVPGARLGRARAYLQQEKSERALDEILRAEPSIPESPELHQLKATALLRLDRMDEAAEAAAKAIEADPSNARNYLLRAQAQFNKREGGAQQQVFADLTRALELQSRMPQARLLLTQWFTRNNRLGEAISEARRLVDRYPDVRQFHENLTRLFLHAGMFDRMEQHLERWSKQSPDDPAIARFEAELAEKRGNLPKAIDSWREVLERDATKSHLFRYLAVLLRAGRAAEAVKVVQANRESLPSSPRFLAVYARALVLSEDVEQGLSFFRQALATAGNNASELQRVIREARKVLSPDELLPLLIEADRVDDSGYVSLVVAQLYLRRGDQDTGIRRLEEIRDEIPKDSPVRGRLLTTLGTAYSQAGDNEKAEGAYREALESMPEDPIVLNNLAYALAVQGRAPYEATKLAERALAATGTDTEARAYYLDTLAFTQYKVGLLFQARENLLNSKKLESMPVNNYHLGLVYLEQGNPKLAHEALTEAARLSKVTGNKQYAADIEEALDRTQEMLADMPRAPEPEPEEDDDAQPED